MKDLHQGKTLASQLIKEAPDAHQIRTTKNDVD